MSKKRNSRYTFKKMCQEAIEYKAEFDKTLARKDPIYANDNFTTFYEIQEGEEFRQVFTADPTALNYEARRYFAPYLFESNMGTLITMNGEKPRVLSLHFRQEGQSNARLVYGVQTYIGKDNNRVGKQITYDPSTLIALCWGSYEDPTAQEIQEKFGLDGHGRKTQKGKVSSIECHHIHDYKRGETIEETKGFLAENVRPDNLQLLTASIHRDLTAIPNATTATPEQEQSYSKRIANTLQKIGAGNCTAMFCQDLEKNEEGGYNIKAKYFNAIKPLYADPLSDEAKQASPEVRENDYFNVFMNDKQAVIDCHHSLQSGDPAYIYTVPDTNRRYGICYQD